MLRWLAEGIFCTIAPITPNPPIIQVSHCQPQQNLHLVLIVLHTQGSCDANGTRFTASPPASSCNACPHLSHRLANTSKIWFASAFTGIPRPLAISASTAINAAADTQQQLAATLAVAAEAEELRRAFCDESIASVQPSPCQIATAASASADAVVALVQAAAHAAAQAAIGVTTSTNAFAAEAFASAAVDAAATAQGHTEAIVASTATFLDTMSAAFTCDALAAMLAFMINTFGIIFAVRDQAVSMGRAHRALPSWWPCCTLHMLNLGWLLRLLPKLLRSSTRHVVLPSWILAMLLLCLLVQPAMGSMNADLGHGSAATENTDGEATHQSLLEVSAFPSATADTSPGVHPPLVWFPIHSLPLCWQSSQEVGPAPHPFRSLPCRPAAATCCLHSCDRDFAAIVPVET